MFQKRCRVFLPVMELRQVVFFFYSLVFFSFSTFIVWRAPFAIKKSFFSSSSFKRWFCDRSCGGCREVCVPEQGRCSVGSRVQVAVPAPGFGSYDHSSLP